MVGASESPKGNHDRIVILRDIDLCIIDTDQLGIQAQLRLKPRRTFWFAVVCQVASSCQNQCIPYIAAAEVFNIVLIVLAPRLNQCYQSLLLHRFPFSFRSAPDLNRVSDLPEYVRRSSCIKRFFR